MDRNSGMVVFSLVPTQVILNGPSNTAVSSELLAYCTVTREWPTDFLAHTS